MPLLDGRARGGWIWDLQMKKNIFKIFLIALILATAFLFELLLNPVTKGNKYYILQKWEEAERGLSDSPKVQA